MKQLRSRPQLTFAFALGVLLLAACGDGGEQTSRSRDAGSEASSAELRQLELAVEGLDRRLERLEAATEELLELLGDDAALLRDLPELIDDLQRRRAQLGAAAEALLNSAQPQQGDDEDVCGFIDLTDCPEEESLAPPAR